MTFSRHYIPPDNLPVWAESSVMLQSLYVSDEGTIEDEGRGMLEMDFADK